MACIHLGSHEDRDIDTRGSRVSGAFFWVENAFRAQTNGQGMEKKKKKSFQKRVENLCSLLGVFAGMMMLVVVVVVVVVELVAAVRSLSARVNTEWLLACGY